MQLSARNQLNATVDTVTHGEVMSTVRVTLPDGQHITAAITKDAAEELEFATGDDVIVVIKSTEVMLAKQEATARGYRARPRRDAGTLAGQGYGARLVQATNIRRLLAAILADDRGRRWLIFSQLALLGMVVFDLLIPQAIQGIVNN